MYVCVLGPKCLDTVIAGFRPTAQFRTITRQNVVVYARKLTYVNEECSESGKAFTAGPFTAENYTTTTTTTAYRHRFDASQSVT